MVVARDALGNACQPILSLQTRCDQGREGGVRAVGKVTGQEEEGWSGMPGSDNPQHNKVVLCGK